MNLIVKLVKNDGTEIQDSQSLSSLIDSAGMGLLIFPSDFFNSDAKITITDAFGTVIINNQDLTSNISLRNGEYEISITQFGITKEYKVLILGNTTMPFEDDTVSWTLAETREIQTLRFTASSTNYNCRSIGNIIAFKGSTTFTVSVIFGQIANTNLYYQTQISNASDGTIEATVSETNTISITSSRTITIPISGTFEVWACGGGGGGQGGRGSGSTTTRAYCGGGGTGGNGGVVKAKMLSLNKNESINITIGNGGSAGSGGSAGDGGYGGYGTSGTTGGTTIFGTYFSCAGGAGGTSSGNAKGGDGCNATQLEIFDETYAYGVGGQSVGRTGTLQAGTASAIPNNSRYPNAGDGGRGGKYSFNHTDTFGRQGIGGLGANGLTDSIGNGGAGGDGGITHTAWVTNTSGESGTAGTAGRVIMVMKL